MERYGKSINKFNGQYLKCIVSNYTSSKNLLANSGSLIVIQPKTKSLNDATLEAEYENGTLHRNYVYLGDEFLASGFGFASESVLRKAEQIVKTYDDDIAALKNKDIELDNKIDIETSKLWEALNDYVKIEGGHIENTVVTLNGYDIPTKDIILYGEEAKYYNMEIKNIDVKIDNIKCTTDEILLPIGSIANKVEVEIELAKHDSGGISSLYVLHKIDDNEYEGTKVLYNMDTSITIDTDYDLYKIFYSKDLIKSNNSFVIDSYKEGVLQRFYINVAQTPRSEYKYYPLLEEKYGVKIISSGNAIGDNTIDIGKSISIRPQYYMKYSNNGLLDASSFTNNIPLNSFKDFDETIVRFEITDEMTINKSIYIAIPSNFSAYKIYMVRNNTELYNWTGAVSIIRNKKMTCVNTGTDSSNSYFIDYDIYCINAKNGFSDGTSGDSYQVELNIIYNYAKDNIVKDGDYVYNAPVVSTNVSNSDTLLSTNNYEQINDEEFNNLYWINYTNTYVDILNNVSAFKNRLSNTAINGAVKIQDITNP